MKTLTLLFSLVFSFSLFAKIIVVSDLDDTIKIINSGNEVEAARNALTTNLVFTAIPSFYQELARYTDELHILSAGPSLLRNKIINDLGIHNIEFKELELRKLSRWEDKLTHKVNYLVKLMKENPEAKFILLGDDVGKDPEAYDEIMRHYPGRVLASYIHMIKNRQIAKSQTKFWLTTDLFVREYNAGRMPMAAVTYGFEQLLNEENSEMMIPSFAHCPKTSIAWSWQILTPFRSEANKLVKKITSYCTNRLIEGIPL
ncbi:MAG TPA: phosphatase domain-containing protein [Bacteriovoracaceae bacterium]|nr:phosphatase domain-containing protein [Bacteriovoracaceae bacterium]